MNPGQLRQLIIEVLHRLNGIIPFSYNAVELLMLTAGVESNFGKFLVQIGGPALGIFQMEPATEESLWDNYLIYRDRMYMFVRNNFIYTNSYYDPYGDSIGLWANIPYQIVMARLRYFVVSEKLPAKENVDAMARYWKRYYNTYLGAGDPDEAVEIYRKEGL